MNNPMPQFIWVRSALNALTPPLSRSTGRGGKGVAVAISLALLCACAKEPFRPDPVQPLTNANPAEMRSRLAQTLPERFTTDDTLIVEAPFHDDMVFLGVLQVDRRRDSFEFIALNPAGIKLFDLRGDDSSVAVAQVLPPLEGLHKILLWVAHDLQHIYLDMVPPPTAVAHIHSDEVVYSQKSSNGTLVYRVAADGGNIPFLVEKRLGDWLGTIWRVRYFRYAPSSAGLYPHGIVMDNDQYHYRIIVKNRDVQVDP